MLDAVVRTIGKLQERIRAHRDFVGQYEHRTRVSLIDPLLYALGWDVGDPAQVALEKPKEKRTEESGSGDGRRRGGRPDYALLGESGKPVLLIEAKKLAVRKFGREPMEQLCAYVIGENFQRDYKVAFGALTNGDVWQVIDIVRQDVVLETCLSQDAPADCAFKLLGLWRHSLIDGSLRTPVELHAKMRVDPSVQESRPSQQRATRRSAVETPAVANRTYVTGETALRRIAGKPRDAMYAYVDEAHYKKPKPNSINNAIYEAVKAAQGSATGHDIVQAIRGFKGPQTGRRMTDHQIVWATRELVKKERLHVQVSPTGE